MRVINREYSNRVNRNENEIKSEDFDKFSLIHEFSHEFKISILVGLVKH